MQVIKNLFLTQLKDKNFKKKLKHEPGLKKPGDFTVSEGHRYPLEFNLLDK
jgi:hypothetical protein